MKYKDRTYKIVPYNPDWSKQFAVIAKNVKEIFGEDALDIQHIGSTSVPGMEGKPTIDLLVLVQNIAVMDKHISAMQAHGYTYAGEVVRDNSRLFREIRENEIVANIHIFLVNHPHVHEMIALRNYLRTHPDDVTGYSQIKKELYGKYKTDYAQYRKYKDEYLDGMLKDRVFK